MTTVDDYVKNVIEKGDEGSALLAAKTVSTLKNSNYVQIIAEGMNGIAALQLPLGKYVVVHSTTGTAHMTDPASHTMSMVDNLMAQAQALGATPIAFANVIDSATGDIDLLTTIADSLKAMADKYKLAIMNGENAILGDRITQQANVMGTMISVVELGANLAGDMNKVSVGALDGIQYATFNPKGNFVVINSDGTGTKPEFAERRGVRSFPSLIYDFLAMNADDAAKLGLDLKVVSGVAEISEKMSIIISGDMQPHLDAFYEQHGIGVPLQTEYVGKRLQSYAPGVPAINISGSAVSTIDPERLKNPLTLREGDTLVAIAGNPNPRSNGISAKRKLMGEMFGDEYHTTPIGNLFLEYLSQPSIVLYPLFKKLIDADVASGVFHMSGGAHDGKLARPIAKAGLYVEMSDLFQPDWRESALAGRGFTSAENAYRTWPMGNDGYVATNNLEQTMKIIDSYGLKAKPVGTLVKDQDKTGVTLKDIKASDGNDVYYPGK